MSSHLHGNRVVHNPVRVFLHPDFFDLSGKILVVIAVTHFHQALQRTSHGCIMQMKTGPVLPLYIIQPVDVCLVHLLIGGSCHTFQLIVVVPVHQSLPSGNFHDKACSSGIPVQIVRVTYFRLYGFHIHNLRELVQEQRPPVPKFVGLHIAAEFNGIDLLVQGSNLVRQGIDLIDFGLDLLVHILLQLLQIPHRAVKIFRQRAGISDKLLFRGQIIRVVHPCLKPCYHQLVKYRLEPGILSVVIKIAFQLLHIVLLLAILAYL